MADKSNKLNPMNFLMLTIAGIINGFGVTVFLFPMKLYDSGISGVSMLLDQVTPSYLTMSIFLIVLNFPIFLFGIKKQGIPFTVYSIYTIAVYSLVSYLIKLVAIDVTFRSPLAEDDLILCAIFGGALSGVGSGMTIRFGGAIDGIDVLSVTFAKKIGISIGSFNMLFNATLYIICGFVFRSWILPLYSVLTYFVGAKTVDFVVDGFDRAKCAMIITEKADEIIAELNRSHTSSGTVVKGKGGYTGRDKSIIYLIVNAFQVYKIRQLVHEIDKNAFISLIDVSDVFTKTEEE